MTRLFTIVGCIVVLAVLASSGVLHGTMCAGKIACVGASNGGITLKGTGGP